MSDVESSQANGVQAYSDSVNTMGGCLGFCLEVISIVCSIFLFLALAPWVGLILLVWWIIACVFGLVFPGKEFFPIQSIHRSVSDWCKRVFGHSLADIALLSLFVVVAGAVIDGIHNLFSHD